MAMNAAGLGLQALAARINEGWEEDTGTAMVWHPAAVPPVSFQLIGFLATNGSSGRDTTKPRTADLIEDALSVARGSLFERVEIPEAKDSVPA
jgi:hypothetical protein